MGYRRLDGRGNMAGDGTGTEVDKALGAGSGSRDLKTAVAVNRGCRFGFGFLSEFGCVESDREKGSSGRGAV